MFKNFLLAIFLIFLNYPSKAADIFNAKQLPFNKVIIWGHKLHSHTHSYIHFGFYRAFEYLGYKVFWFDDQDKFNGFDFSKSLFITAGEVDKKIPLRNDCLYILHNCDSKKYNKLYEQNCCITLQVYTHSCLEKNVKKVDDYIYTDLDEKTIYIPWATDVLPHEIDEIKKEILHINKTKNIYFIGTLSKYNIFENWNAIESFSKACKENNINFHAIGGYTGGTNRISMEENIKLIKTSYMAPALQGKWQCEKGYIPCRIFKNISYGQMGITNSKTVYNLFKGKIIYNEDTYKLFYDAKQKIESMSLEELYGLMDFVRDNHTYINRIQVLLEFLEEIHNR